LRACDSREGADLKKLLTLKQWLTVPDAARHLSILFGEDVSEADVLRLALDGHLTLSVHFVNRAWGNPGRVLSVADAKMLTRDLEGKPLELTSGSPRNSSEVVQFQRTVQSLDGVWDLTMLGTERLDVEHRYQELTGGPSIQLVNLHGPIISRSDGLYFRILGHFGESEHFDQSKLHKPWKHEKNFYPAGALPSDTVFVVRTSALQQLESTLAESEYRTKRPIGQRERTTLLVIIAALAKLSRIDVAKPSSAATSIESQTALMGARVAARTIENHLKRIPEALESKSEED
jgi:hypothetical protein